jgi:hypothetical protein
MSTVADLELSIIRVACIFLFISFVFKFSLRRLNGFDALGLIVLLLASFNPMLKKYGSALLEMVFLGIVVGALAIKAGSNRRGTLFISGILVLSDAIVNYKQLIGPLEDLNDCLPIMVGTGIQAFLLALVAYALIETRSHKKDEEGEQEVRVWLIIVLGASVFASFFHMYTCQKESENSVLGGFFNFVRVIVVAIACVANGEDEMIPDEI